jgi:hypothetical protein
MTGQGSALVGGFVLAHQLAGYATAFVVAPIALFAFVDPARHRPWAKLFVYAMIPLYLTGLAFTFRLHDAGSFVWARNLAFNFTGFFFLLVGWRAIWRLRHRRWEPGTLDRAMRAILVAGGVALVALGATHHFPSFALGALTLWMALRVLRESPDARALLVRHQRAMLTAYFYLLTVLSLVHVRAPTDVKWLWPALLGGPIVAYATRDGPNSRRMGIAVRCIVAIAMVFALYIAFVSPPVFLRER